jgi:hypothetical protein
MLVVVQEAKLEDRLSAAGAVPDKIVAAIGAVLSDKELDGAFVAAAISLPAAAELIGSIPNIDPVLLHNVRCSVRAPCRCTSVLRLTSLGAPVWCQSLFRAVAEFLTSWKVNFEVS